MANPYVLYVPLAARLLSCQDLIERSFRTTLRSWEGKTFYNKHRRQSSMFCGVKKGWRADRDKRHCAHFVQHVLGLERSEFGRVNHIAGKVNPASFRRLDVKKEPTSPAVIVDKKGQKVDLTVGLIYVTNGTCGFTFRNGRRLRCQIEKRKGKEKTNGPLFKHIGIYVGSDVWHFENDNGFDYVVGHGLLDLSHKKRRFWDRYAGQENEVWISDFPTGSRPRHFTLKPSRCTL